MFSLTTLARPITSQGGARIVVRGLSTQTSAAVEKLKTVLEGYRLANYTQELPTRFKKELTKAAVVHDDFVGIDGVERVLMNIGAQQRLSHEDLNLIFSEMGQGGEIPASLFIKLI
mmetsp:Transcript_2090/g.4545  ORF Transcript_2090/g.4545 Transcript_2090/m.4545 type:complete len:116 (+) Transcript_2090:253-600(+)